ncbi:MAG: class I SAM-dependent methyltransferase [Terriglobia bacterium]
MANPDPTPITELIHAFRYSKIMFAGVSLKIFDLLGDGPKDVKHLAGRTATQPDALERLLDACVGLGLLRKEGDQYSNEPVAETYLRRSSESTLAGYILYSNSALYRLWGNLEDAIREGTSRWAQTFGSGGASPFDQLFKTDEARRDFLMGMHGFGLLSSPHVVAAFDLSAYRRLVDVGGATGHLAMAACDRYPKLRAAIFDLPDVIKIAREYVQKRGLSDRIDFIAGDFFEDPLPEADLFSLGRILHDWSEQKVRKLLKKIYQTLPSGGALIIAERLLDEDKTGPLNALAQSLNMLVCVEGKERSLAEYTALLRDAGFTEVRGQKTGAPLDAVLAIKER